MTINNLLLLSILFLLLGSTKVYANQIHILIDGYVSENYVRIDQWKEKREILDNDVIVAIDLRLIVEGNITHLTSNYTLMYDPREKNIVKDFNMFICKDGVPNPRFSYEKIQCFRQINLTFVPANLSSYKYALKIDATKLDINPNWQEAYIVKIYYIVPDIIDKQARQVIQLETNCSPIDEKGRCPSFENIEKSIILPKNSIVESSDDSELRVLGDSRKQIYFTNFEPNTKLEGYYSRKFVSYLDQDKEKEANRRDNFWIGLASGLLISYLFYYFVTKKDNIKFDKKLNGIKYSIDKIRKNKKK